MLENVFIFLSILLFYSLKLGVAQSFIDLGLLSYPDPHSETQVLEGKGGGSGWPGGSERRMGLFVGQHPRPRAFSQSAVHTLEQRERERDLEKVRGC